MNIDLIQVIKDSNSRIAEADLKLLQRACDYCKAAYILEIGSADGGSSVILAAKAKEQAGHLYCIEPKPKQRMKDNMVKYGVENHYTMIPKFSPWVPSEMVPDNQDLLFIDGYHELRWCLCDYHYWAPKVREGGVIVFHDFYGGTIEDHRQKYYRQKDYISLVARAVDIILETDNLKEIDRCGAPRGGAPRGGAIAFEKGPSIK